MGATLQQAFETLKSLRQLASVRKRRKAASALTGTCKGLLPDGLTSAIYLRQLRDGLYGKLRLP